MKVKKTPSKPIEEMKELEKEYLKDDELMEKMENYENEPEAASLAAIKILDKYGWPGY